ncbi:MAG: fibronectin type III-like domain-contianing protein, partial [Omnitrophica WOR_2 bacterium]
VSLPWLDSVPAVVEAYYPGMEGGNAVARVLTGEVNPSGKLPVTFPRRFEDTPAFTNQARPETREILYGEGIFVGYRHYDARQIDPLFPFGYGLSYTSYQYTDIQAPEEAQIGEPIAVTVTVKNTGARPGKEVVQLYVRDPFASVPRPEKELKGFQKVSLEPGQEQPVQFILDKRAFAFYDPERKDWIVEPGEFEILVGASSRDIRLTTKIVLK